MTAAAQFAYIGGVNNGSGNMSEEAEGMAVAALAGICLFVGLAYMLAYAVRVLA